MLRSLEKILKILNLEIQGKFLNKAIIGGLDKFFPNWVAEAKAENVPDAVFTKIQNHFINYAQMDPSERESSTREILSAIRTQYSPHSSQSRPVNHPSSPPEKPTPTESKPRTATKNYGATSTQSGPALGLNAPVTALQGIGSTKKELFQSIGINKIHDLLYYFPRRYIDYSELKPINRIEFGEELTVVATVQSQMTTPIKRKNQARIEVVVSDGTGFLRLVFFRPLKYAAGIENKYRRGSQHVISGKVTMYLGRKQINEPNTELLDQTHLNTNRITPVYSLTAGLTQKDLRVATNNASTFYAAKLTDYLPTPLKDSAGLIDLPLAIRQVHYPDNFEILKSAMNRLAFDEIFFLQLGVQQQKKNWKGTPAEKYEITDEQLEKFTDCLPYSLTNAQKRVIEEIRNDLSSGFPMNRLIQGDVGSGKTIVAAIASLSVNIHGGQTAFMAPTSILAEQHFHSLQKVLVNNAENELSLPDSAIRLLTGDTSAQERAEIDAGCQDGSIKILVGTHALIEDPVKFKNLQLAIIDEQHRFGIAQRSALRQKGENPHLLVMSATPIPRSLALTIFGDLDISIIDEMPAGRLPVNTEIIHPFARERAYHIINDEIAKGHQAFIIYPLIEKGDDEDQKAAADEHPYLQEEIFSHLKLGLLHGRMPADEKETIMKKFRDKEFDILVSTTVIEVGVDIPNATVMMIEGANRFGLAQLHQLRGRVGRGSDSAYCLLIPDNEDALENERLAVMTETNDGFILAERDLEQRGPGDFIGYRQSGFADLRMASITDIHLIEKARHFAEEIFKDDPQLEKIEHQPLAQKLKELWTGSESDIS